MSEANLIESYLRDQFQGAVDMDANTAAELFQRVRGLVYYDHLA